MFSCFYAIFSSLRPTVSFSHINYEYQTSFHFQLYLGRRKIGWVLKQTILSFICMSVITYMTISSLYSCVVVCFVCKISFLINLIFLDIVRLVGAIGFSDGDFGHFTHHTNFVGASSYVLGYVDSEARWWIWASNGEWNENAQSDQDDGDGVDEDGFIAQCRVLLFRPVQKWSD